jgi:hypothetical protein
MEWFTSAVVAKQKSYQHCELDRLNAGPNAESNERIGIRSKRPNGATDELLAAPKRRAAV